MGELLATLHPPVRRTTSECPACHDGELVPFLELTGMPVFNNVLRVTQEAARVAAVGDVELSLCLGCGLISNTAFRPELIEYSPAYENSLHGSATFVQWARGLARSLASRHELRGGRILEIGAGTGEFLELLCEESGAHGVGFDPSHAQDVDRGVTRSAVSAELLPDDLLTPADLVLCRHVLEHVDDPVGFLRAAASAVRPNRTARVPLYVEVPDAAHMLERQAFWDVIYEHPLYFDQHSLRATVSAAGLEPRRWGRTYGDQFVWIEACTGGTTRKPHHDGAAVASLLRHAEAFAERFRRQIARRAEEIGRADGRVAVWGAGSKGVTFCNIVPGASSAVVIDVSHRKHGRHLPRTGQQIQPPDVLRDDIVDLVYVMNPIYELEIREELERAGVQADVVVA